MKKLVTAAVSNFFRYRFATAREITSNKIFVCGCGHSGTSLIASMLGAHKRIYAINNETYLFVENSIIFPERSDDYIINFFKEEIDNIALHNNCDLICEKTPIHIHCLDRINKLFPNSKIVVPVRDPRDVAASMKQRTSDFREGYMRWLTDNEVVKRQIIHSNSKIFVFRYEDLIEEPTQTLKKICSFLDISFDTNMLSYHKDARNWFGATQIAGSIAPTPDNHVEFRNWQIKQPLLDRRGRWKTLLSLAECTEVEDACGEMMRYFGYSPSP